MVDSFHESLVSILRASAVSGISWGESASPYYDEVPEPPPAFPFVSYEIPDSTIEHAFSGNYIEKYLPTIYVVCLEQSVATLTSPYIAGSVFYFLDSYAQNPTPFSGSGFSCMQFIRLGYSLKRDTSLRSPAGGRVWIASATYEALVQAPYQS